MKPEQMTATATLGVPRAELFDILADPSTHAAIDGTGRVCKPVDDARLDHVGQVFRMAMYHPDHPDKNYETFNRVEVFDRPSAISWKPGYIADSGELAFGGWTWRYDLADAGPGATVVTLTYDWSAVPADVRRRIGFPPFDQQHFDRSLEHLADVASERR
jgi:hypothetical protein